MIKKTLSLTKKKKNIFFLTIFFIIFFLITFLLSSLVSQKKPSSFKTKAAEELCPDGGIWQGNGCDYGKYDANMQPTLNQCLIDSGVDRCWEKCIKTYYNEQSRMPEGGYGPCHYVNANVCRRLDRIGGCAGVCNYECCVGISQEMRGEEYDLQNPPGSSHGQCRGPGPAENPPNQQENPPPQQPPPQPPTPTSTPLPPSPTSFPTLTPTVFLPSPTETKPLIKKLTFTFKTVNCKEQAVLKRIWLYDEKINLLAQKEGGWFDGQVVSLDYEASSDQIWPYVVIEKNGYFSFWGPKIYPNTLSNTIINFDCQNL